jgi:hypothetical protein
MTEAEVSLFQVFLQQRLKTRFIDVGYTLRGLLDFL